MYHTGNKSNHVNIAVIRSRVFLLAVSVYFTWPHHRLTALLFLYMCVCKCQSFTDEGSRRLPKRLNYCFSVLASAMNRSTWVYLATQVYIVAIRLLMWFKKEWILWEGVGQWQTKLSQTDLLQDHHLTRTTALNREGVRLRLGWKCHSCGWVVSGSKAERAQQRPSKWSRQSGNSSTLFKCTRAIIMLTAF